MFTRKHLPPGGGEVSIDVRSIAVNPRDVKTYLDPSYSRAANQQLEFPIDIGVEAAGVVSAMGPDAVGPAGPIEVGDEVIAFRISGAYADRIVVKASAVIPRPSKISWEQAGSMMLVGTTAAHTLAAVRARPGQTVLLHGAGGGVGLSAVQLAGLNGIYVVGTGSAKHFDIMRRYGATPVRFGDGLERRIKSEVMRPIDAAIDVIGTDEAIDVSLALVADRSKIATIVNFGRAKREGIQALGGSAGQNKSGIAIRANARLLISAYAQTGAIEFQVHQRFPLKDVVAAHESFLNGGGGRIVLTC